MGETLVIEPLERARRAKGARWRAGARGARRILIAAVIVPLLVALAGAGGLMWQTHRMRETAAWARESDRVVDEANALLESFLDQETGLRGFLLSEDPAFLQPYERANPREVLDALERKLADKPERLAIVRALRREYLAWERSARKEIAMPGAARRIGNLTERKANMDRMRALLAELVKVQGEKREEQYATFERESLLAGVGAGVFLAVLGGAAAIGSRRQLRLIDAAFAAERAAARAKDEFLSTLSHELRTPLTPILGWARMLRTRPLAPDARERAFVVIERNAHKEAQIIEDVLDTASIAAGKLTIAHDAVDPRAVAREAVEVARLAAEERGVVLDVRVDPEVPEVIGDAPRLRQVVWHLLDNALKFTPRGRRVELSVSREGSDVHIRVADEGEGIAKGALPHVFERFWQSDSSATRRCGGLGLGLAIVKVVVKLHGGEVIAASEGPGRGAVFTVTLPVAAVRPRGTLEAPAHAAPELSLRGRRVLVVDDDPGARDVLAAVLAAQGAEVHVAASAPEALDELAHAKIDMLVSDIGMPGLSGYDLIGTIRRSRRRGRLPALAVSAYAGTEDVKKAIDAGFQVHLAKPVDIDRLVGTVARLCGPQVLHGASPR